jgi:hypothetical protein
MTLTELHLVSVNDDLYERQAVCSECGVLYEGTNRNRKFAALHFHMFEIFKRRAEADGQ